MLMFMPWCPIDKCYEVDDIYLLPFTRHKLIDGLDKTDQCRINTIIGIYKDLEGKPVRNATIVRYDGHSPIDDLTDDQIEIAKDLTALACFCGLAKRKYFNAPGPYCNSDCFSLYIQKFDKPDFTALTTRRRDGVTWSIWPVDDVSITIPVHCHTVQDVSVDTDLLKALVDHRHHTKPEKSEWGKWQNAISCFNQASTDSNNMRPQMELVLLCSAFEHLLSTRSNAEDVARRFAETLTPSDKLLAQDAMRLSNQRKNAGKSVRYEWMRDFYRIRNDFAHGNLSSQRSSGWNLIEHLVLATIAFPLLVKSLLSKACEYKMTDGDQAQIDVFEKFADTTDFLKPPPDQKSSSDSHWKRLVNERSRKIAIERAVKRERKNLTP